MVFYDYGGAAVVMVKVGCDNYYILKVTATTLVPCYCIVLYRRRYSRIEYYMLYYTSDPNATKIHRNKKHTCYSVLSFVETKENRTCMSYILNIIYA